MSQVKLASKEEIYTTTAASVLNAADTEAK